MCSLQRARRGRVYEAAIHFVHRHKSGAGESGFPEKTNLPPDLAAANQAITNRYGVKGFPTLLALDADGKVLWNQPGYLDGGPKAMIAKLDQAKKKK